MSNIDYNMQKTLSNGIIRTNWNLQQLIRSDIQAS